MGYYGLEYQTDLTMSRVVENNFIFWEEAKIIPRVIMVLTHALHQPLCFFT